MKFVFSRRFIASMLAFFVFTSLSYSLGEQNSWDCPDCGRTGNTGNYCGGCAHPAPWILLNKSPEPMATQMPTSTPTPTLTPKPTPTPIPLLSNVVASIETSEDKVSIHVVWEGGKRPYHVYLYPYKNENHNIGKEVDYVDLQVAQNQSIGGKEVYFGEYLTPGQTYWIKIEDDSKQELWSKFTFPQILFSGFEVKIQYVLFEDRKYGNNGYTATEIGKNKIAKNKLHIVTKNEERYPHSLIRLSGNHSDLFPEDYKKFDLWSFTLVTPNGDLLAGGKFSNSRYTNDTQKYRELDLVFNTEQRAVVNPMIYRLYKTYQDWSNIPIGKYSVIISYGNYYVGTQEITITN